MYSGYSERVSTNLSRASCDTVNSQLHELQDYTDRRERIAYCLYLGKTAAERPLRRPRRLLLLYISNK